MKQTTTSNCEYDTRFIQPMLTNVIVYGWVCPKCGSVMAPWQN